MEVGTRTMVRKKPNPENDDADGDSFYPFLHTIQHAKKRAFLVAYCECFSVSEAAVLAGIERTSHYYWLGTDEAYLEAFRQAKQVAAETLESELVRRALRGVERLKFFKGQPILIPCHEDDFGAVEIEDGDTLRHFRQYSEHEYSDVLGMFLLKGAMPEKYRERYEHTIQDKELNDTIEHELEKLADRDTPAAPDGDPQPPAIEGG